jgi:hypothetical protein
LVVGILGGIAAIAVAAWYIRRWALKTRNPARMSTSDTQQYLVEKRN